ncbi:hypothetical protein BegalDRAFT_2454 [Beggiatoa alba B18LD]|uniref:Uncharacterized protein n=1 Tax=Beggiatoa alba B18LD TaxID=395493 RepID=I3CI61_9GAMM|nr:hypothetical protein [Beggiatoa alba]EIJ43304.1 hypothetical protein BegalDRAFT_2454 [Beggiatoa alba B18LD]
MMNYLAWLKQHIRCVFGLMLAFLGGLFFADNHPPVFAAETSPTVWQTPISSHYVNEPKPANVWQVAPNPQASVISLPLYNPWKAQASSEPQYRPLQESATVTSPTITENRYRTPEQTAIASPDYRPYQPSSLDMMNSMEGRNYPVDNRYQVPEQATIVPPTEYRPYSVPAIGGMGNEGQYWNNSPTATYPPAYQTLMPAYSVSPFYGQSLETVTPATLGNNPLYMPMPYQEQLTPIYPSVPFYNNQFERQRMNGLPSPQTEVRDYPIDNGQQSFLLPNMRLMVVPDRAVVPTYDPFTGYMVAPSLY